MKHKNNSDKDSGGIVIGHEHSVGFTWGAYLGNPFTVVLLDHDIFPGLYSFDDDSYVVWHPTPTSSGISHAVATMIHEHYWNEYRKEDMPPMRPDLKICYEHVVPRMIFVTDTEKSYLGALKLRYPFCLLHLGEDGRTVYPVETLRGTSDEETMMEAGEECLRFLTYHFAEETHDADNQPTADVPHLTEMHGQLFPEYWPHLDVLLEKLVTEFVEYDGALGPKMSDKLFKAAGEALDDIGLDLTHRCIQYVYGQRAEGK